MWVPKDAKFYTDSKSEGKIEKNARQKVILKKLFFFGVKIIFYFLVCFIILYYDTVFTEGRLLHITPIRLLLQDRISLDVGKFYFFCWRPVCVAGHTMKISIIVIMIETFLAYNFSVKSWEHACHRRWRRRC